MFVVSMSGEATLRESSYDQEITMRELLEMSGWKYFKEGVTTGEHYYTRGSRLLAVDEVDHKIILVHKV